MMKSKPNPIEKRTIRSQAVLAVDVGKNYGATLFLNGEMHRIWSGKISMKVIGGILKYADDFEVVLVLEAQYLGNGKKGGKGRGTVKTMQTLLKRRHEWEVIAELFEIPYQSFMPVSWQTILKISPAIGGTTKEKSMALAKRRWPDIEFTEDSADSSCMGLWYIHVQQKEHL